MNSKSRRSRNARNSVCRKSERADSRGKAEKSSEVEPTTAPYNDASWYARNPQLLKDAASLSFNIPVGARMRLEDYYPLGAEAYWSVAEVHDRVPSIMTIMFGPSIGISGDNSSAINIAARNIYSYVRHQNSGHANYDSPDLMMYLLAMDSAYMLWNVGKRLYGAINLYSQYNAALPDTLIKSMGFDALSIRSNIANLRYFLNQAAAKLNSFAVPATMPLMIRHSWMVSNVWRDAYSEKSQLYVYTPYIYHQWTEVEAGPGKLAAKNFVEAGTLGTITYETYVQQLTNVITAISSSEDCGIISGDILKAYSTSGLLTLSAISEDYLVVPVYNEEVLTQIQNANPVQPNDVDSWSITQSTGLDDKTAGALLFHPKLAIGARFNVPKFINLPWNKTEPSDVMVASRLMVATGPATSSSADLIGIGSEVIVALAVWLDSNTYVQLKYQVRLSRTSDEGTVRSALHDMTLLSNFDWHPQIPVGYTKEGDGAPVDYIGTLCDFNNYTPVSDITISKMHDTALLSLFGVPVNGLV